MGVRTAVYNGLNRIAKVFGPGVPESFTQGEAASQMTPASPFSPGTPIGPYDGYDRAPRTQDFVTGYNIATRPRTHERVSFDTLTGLIEAYDVAQLAIWHRIDGIRSLDWKLVAADGYDGDVSDAITIGMYALEEPDRESPFDSWLAKYLYDVLAYDAGALYRMRNRGGRCVGLRVVDGRMIAPLLDYWGNSPAAVQPGDPEPEAYVQYVNGLPWNWLTRSDLIYEPFRPVPNSPYGRAPLESIILNANTDIRFQVYFLQRFTEGNLPAAFASAPDSWSPDQIEQFQGYWDAVMYGDQSKKHDVRWMPPGSKFVWSNEKDFTDTFSLFLMRKSLAAYHVVPSDMGFTEDVNRSSGESQADVQHRIGDLPLIRKVQRLLTKFLQRDLGLPLKHAFDLGEDQDDRLNQAQCDDIYIKNGTISASSIAEMRFGVADPRPIPRYIFTERSGPVPVIALDAVAGAIDPATALPALDAPLPHEAFTEVQGVISNPPLIGEPLAEQEFGPSALPSAGPPQPGTVVKDGDGAAGITSETGIYGDPLLRGDDEDEPDEAAVAKEMAAFRRFERARRKNGAWRDFTFAAVDPVTAHNLNDSGRLAVRKAAGEIAVAGLAVLAADTGRVLMLQRALTDDDPAAGCWEMPGGGIEQGETPMQGAWREWAEETGRIPPPGTQTGEWNASNGIYQGIVWTIGAEAMVPVRSDTEITNPDDPDGDAVEAIAWWEPSQLPGNPAMRPELLADMDAVMAALGCSQPAEDSEATCPCGTPAVYDEMNGWQHADGSVSHDDGESVSGKMRAVAGPVAKAIEKSKADEVFHQLTGDYPKSSLEWVHHTAWEGPQIVPFAGIDMADRKSWRASHEPARIAEFAARIGKRTARGKDQLKKPAVLVREPGKKKALVVDGHHRLLGAEAAGQDGVLAWVGHVDRKGGPWMELHDLQFTRDSGSAPGSGDDDAADQVGKAADAGLPKAPDGRRWPGWDLDLKAAGHWAPLLAAALAGALSEAQAKAIAARYIRDHPEGQQGGQGKREAVEAAAAWLAAQLDLTPRIQPLMPAILAGAYLIGAASAQSMAGDEDVDTGGWQPGDADAAQRRTEALGLGAGLSATLGQSGSAAQAVAGGYMTSLGRVLVDGVTGGLGAAAIGAGLGAVLADKAQAAGEVLGQVVSVIGQAAMALYLKLKVQYGTWVGVDDDRTCATCLENQGAGRVRIGDAYPSGDVRPPIHQHDRCALVPA